MLVVATLFAAPTAVFVGLCAHALYAEHDGA
jgi:hypothetical protein